MNRELKNSEIPWIGDIPSQWKVLFTSSLFHEHKQKNYGLQEKNLLSLSYGKIKRKDINSSEGLLPQSFETYNIIAKGDIVFRLTDLQNDKRSLRTGLCKEQGIITSAYVTLRSNIEIESRYFHYLYHAYDCCKVFYGLGDGVRQGMNFEDVRKLLIIQPSLAEQKAIADFLDVKCAEIDEMIALQEKIIEELKAYKQSVISEVVTKGLNPDAPMKDSGIEWIGTIPNHWGIYRIKYNTFLKGRIGWQGLNSNDFIDEGYCLITGTDFDNKGGIHWDTCYRISKERYDEDVFLHVKEGDLLMTKDGTVGKMAFIEVLPEEASLNSHLLIIRQLTDMIENSFLYWAMLSEEFKGFCSIYQSGSIMNSVSQSTLGDFACACPPKTEQRLIVDFLNRRVSEIDSLLSLKQSKIEHLRAYKKSLIYEYVTGKKEIEV